MSLALKSVCSVISDRRGLLLHGVDEYGQVWEKVNTEGWKKVSMETNLCPRCNREKRNPERIIAADGHGGLNVYCSHDFHA
jgi:hypothetical protein